MHNENFTNPEQALPQEQQNEFVKMAEDMPSFEEHMEKSSTVGEQYVERAKKMKEDFLESGRNELQKAESLQPTDVKKAINQKEYLEGKADELEYEPLTEDDKDEFEKFKKNEIAWAKYHLENYEKVNIDDLAQQIRNAEMLDAIAEKMKKGEDFSEEENEFLGDNPSGYIGYEDVMKCLEPEQLFTGWLVAVKNRFEDVLRSRGEFLGSRRMRILAEAMTSRADKEGRAIIQSNEEIQNMLKKLEEPRTEFAGETNINRATGEQRTYSPEDVYPQLEGESDDDYTKRLKRIQLQTRRFENRNK